MTPRPVHDDPRSETGSAESVFWRKSRHSAAGAGAACVEATLAVRQPDGSLAVETDDGSTFVIVPAPLRQQLETPAEPHLDEPPTEFVAPWTRGSLDDETIGSDDLVTQRPETIETEPVPQLENAHGLPGFGKTEETTVPSDALGTEIGRALRGGDQDFLGRVFVPDRVQQQVLSEHFAQHGGGLRGAPILHVELGSNGLRVVGSSRAPWADERGAYVAQVHQGGGRFYTVPLDKESVARGTQELDGTGLGRGLTRRPSLSNLGEEAPVVLVSCASGEVIDGVEGSEPAQLVANETGRRVYAPTTDVYVSDDGFALINDAHGNPGVWKEFVPNRTQPPRLVTGDIDGVGDEVRDLPADTPSLMYSSNLQRAQGMLHPNETVRTANDVGQPTEWVQSFDSNGRQFTVVVRRNWTDGHETLHGALYDARTHQLVDQGRMQQLQNGRIQLGVNVYRPDGTPQFTFTDRGVRIPGFQEKADHVLGLLRRHLDIVQFTGGRPVNITLRPNSDRTTWGTPAEVVSNAHSVDVWVAEYFFRDYGMPYVMGMLMHEFAVHPMASAHADVQSESEAYAPVAYRNRQTGEVEVDAMPITVPGFGGARTISTVPRQSGPRKQPDHINVARENGYRYKVYQQAILDMALSMHHDSAAHLPGTSRRDARNLMDSYLMDLTSIAVTEDNRAQGVRNPGDMATAYNAYRGLLIQGLRDLSRNDEGILRVHVPAPKTGAEILNDYGRMGFTVFGAVVTGTARNAISSVGSMFGTRRDPRNDPGEGSSRGSSYGYLSGTGNSSYIRMGHDGPETDTTQGGSAPHDVQLTGAPESSHTVPEPVEADESVRTPQPQDQILSRGGDGQALTWARPQMGPYVLHLTRDETTGDVTGSVFDTRVGKFVDQGIPTLVDNGVIGLTHANEQRSNVFTEHDPEPRGVSWDVSTGAPARITFNDGGVTIPGFRQKADQVLDVLRRHTELTDFIGDRPVNITIKPSSDAATMKTPAEVMTGEHSIEVWVAEYYFRNYSTPYVLGMLAHEFGVHPLADSHELVQEESEAYEGMPIVVPGLVKSDGTPRYITTDPRPEGPQKQADHILVARPNGDRYNAYQSVTLDYARLLQDNYRLGKPGSTAHDARDVLDTHLMDLASIAVTEDNRKEGVWSPREIAQVYNNYRSMLLNKLPEFDPLRDQVPAEKNMGNVLTAYAGMGFTVGGAALTNRVNEAVSDISNRMANLFGRRSGGSGGGAVQMGHEPDFTQEESLAQDHVPAPNDLTSHEPETETLHEGAPSRNVQVSSDVLGNDIGRALRGGDEGFLGRVFVPNEAQEHVLANHFAQHGGSLRDAPILHVELTPNGLHVVGESRSPWSDERGALYMAQVHQGRGVFTVPLDQVSRGVGELDGTGLGRGLTRRPSLSNLGEEAPVVLVSCASGEVIDGVEGSEPAQLVANATGRRVYAPTTDVYVSDDGFALINDAHGNPGVWKEFLPNRTQPPRLVTRDIDNVGDEVRDLPADTPSLMHSSSSSRHRSRHSHSSSTHSSSTRHATGAPNMHDNETVVVRAPDDGRPTEWVQSFGPYTVRVTRNWSDGFETISAALYDATTHRLVDQGALQHLDNGRIQVGVNVYRPDGSPQFMFTDSGVRIPGFQQKADHALGLLRRHVDIVQFTAGRPVNITLRPNSDQRTWGTPAEVTSHAGSVDVWIAEYFFRDYGLPYVMGMLMHEFAVHPMASAYEDVRSESEAYAAYQYTDRATGRPAIDAAPIFVPGFGNRRTINTVPRQTGPYKQPDHIIVARGNGYRFKVYQRAIFDLALSMQHDSHQRMPGTSRSDARHLMDSYLMDLASIAVTEDNRARGVFNPGEMATAFNAYRGLLVEGLGDLSRHDAATLLVHVPPEKNAATILNDYRRMGFTVFGAVVTGTARNAISSVGSMFSPRRDPRNDPGEGSSGGAAYGYLSGTGGYDYIRMGHDGPETDTTQGGSAPHDMQLVGAPESSHAAPEPVEVHESVRTPQPQDQILSRGDDGQALTWARPQMGPYVLHLTRDETTGDVTGSVFDTRVGKFVDEGVPTLVDNGVIGLTHGAEQRSNVFTEHDPEPRGLSWDVSTGAPTRITFNDGGVTIPGFRQKADQVLDVLRRHDELTNFMGDRPVNITIKPSSDPATMKSPAEVSARENSIEVWVAEYYFRNYSTPYVLGMLAHEFGVHPLATAHEEVREEDDAFDGGVPIVVPGLVKSDGTPRFLTTDPRPEGPQKQAHHILVARPGGQRYNAYQSVTLDYARLLQDNYRLGKPGSTAHDARDVLDTHLMDLASIAVTEDNRAKGVWSPREIAQVYNNYRSMLLNKLPEFDPLREQVPAEKTAVNVLTAYAGMGFTVGGAALGSRVNAAVSDVGNRFAGLFGRRQDGSGGGAVQMGHEPDFTQDESLAHDVQTPSDLESHEPNLDLAQNGAVPRNVRVPSDVLGNDIGRALRGGDDDFLGRVFVPDRTQQQVLAEHFSRNGGGLRNAPILHVEPNSEGLRVVGSSKAPWADEREAYVAQIHQGRGVFTVPLEQKPATRGAGELDGTGLGRGLTRRPSLSNMSEEAPVVLVSCESGEMIDGVEGSEPAQLVANATGRRVYAPTTDVYVSDDGFALINDAHGNPGVWKEFVPNRTQPPRLVTRDIADIGDEVRDLPADTPSLMHSSSSSRHRSRHSNSSSTHSSSSRHATGAPNMHANETVQRRNDAGQPTEWVQSFGRYNVHVTRDWADGHETLFAALYDARTNELVNSGVLEGMQNGRVRLQDRSGGRFEYRSDGSPQFMFTDGGVRIPGFQAKADHVLGLLRRHDEIVQFSGGRPVNITLKSNSETVTWQTPAQVVSRGDSVDVWLAEYYFRNYSMPYNMGMLMHEFAVHPMASAHDDVQSESDAFGPQAYRNRQTGQVEVDAVPITIPGFGGARTISTVPRQSGPHKQADHIIVARPNGYRFNVYQRAVLDLALTMQHDALRRMPGTSIRDASDLIDCYLMDLASIAVTEDNRAQGVLRPNDVATSYNAYRGLLLDALNQMPIDDAAAIRANVPGLKTAANVLTAYAGMGFTVAGAAVFGSVGSAFSSMGGVFGRGPRPDPGAGGAGSSYGYGYPLAGAGGYGSIRMGHDGPDTDTDLTRNGSAPHDMQLVGSPERPIVVHEPTHTPETPDVTQFDPTPGQEVAPPRFSSAPIGVSWAHARFAKSWGLEFDPYVETAHDALITAGGGSISIGGRELDDADAVRQVIGDRIGVAEPSAEDWSDAAAQLGASVLILHSDGTMSAHGQGPVLVLAESVPEDANEAARWVGLPTSTEDPALSGLSAAQVHWAASGGRRFVGPGGGFFDALANGGRAAGRPELDFAPEVLRDRLVRWMRTDLTDADWRDILGQAGIPAPHDGATQQRIIANVQRGVSDETTHVLLPQLAERHFGVGLQVVHPDGDTRTHGGPGAEPAVTLVPATGSPRDTWFTVGQVRPPLTAGAGTRPADVAGGLGWADPAVARTTDHIGPEPSDPQQDWAYIHGRQLVGAHDVTDAFLRSAGGGFTAKGEYVSDSARVRALLADEVGPALDEDLGLALVVHTIYAAHTPSADALIDSGRARADIIEAIRDPEYRPDLADELMPYFANRLGLGVRTVEPSGMVGRYGNGRPVYVTWTVGEDGRRHWAAAPSDASQYALGSRLRAPNMSDPALFLLNHAIEVRKDALRADGASDFRDDPVIGLLHGAQGSWLEHGREPRSTVGEPLVETWHPDNLEATVTRLVETARASIGGTGAVHDVALGSGLHAGMAIELFDGLFPQGIGHEPVEAVEGGVGVTGLHADQWVVASLPELVSVLPRGGAALLLGGDHTVVVVDTPYGHRLVEFGADELGGPISGRVGIPTSTIEGAGDGLALVVDSLGHPVPAEQWHEALGYEPDSAVGWSFGSGYRAADLETGVPTGVSGHQADWAERHGAEVVPAEPGPNAVFDAVIKAAGGRLSAHGVDVTSAPQLRQVLTLFLRDRTAAPNTLRDFPPIHAAFKFEGVDRVLDEFFDQNPSGANVRAVHLQLEEHLNSGKAATYVVEAMAGPGHWEHVTQAIALDTIADWAGIGVLSVDPGGQVRLHGDPDAPRLAVGRLGSEIADLPGWVALTPDHQVAEPFRDAAVDTASSLTSPIPHTETGEDSFYHAVLDASGGVLQIDRDTQVGTPAELKQQLTTLLLNRPDVLDTATRDAIERETGIGAGAGIDRLIDALNDPTSHEGEVVARHAIGSYLGTELKVVEPDGSEHTYGTGRPISINSVPDERGESHWAALPLESRNLDLDLGREEDRDASAVEADRVEHTQWAPETHTLAEPDKVPVEDPWRSATFCVTMMIDGVEQKACVSVAVLTLDAALAAELGVAVR